VDESGNKPSNEQADIDKTMIKSMNIVNRLFIVYSPVWFEYTLSKLYIKNIKRYEKYVIDT
jgi:hypothetical protein